MLKNDHFRGLQGADIFKGGTGADTYQWYAKDIIAGGKHLGVDRISDFSASDVLDLRGMFRGAEHKQPVNTLVKVTDDARGSHVFAKIGGQFTEVVTLDGVHGVSATSLQHDGALLV
ncbi:MAG: type I secretion C-terminal target domain-containing protein [Hyphomicrobium sp.]|nr:type I secretion C-terminal target domain-containing protein [Hyphomicrobium sp.]